MRKRLGGKQREGSAREREKGREKMCEVTEARKREKDDRDKVR